MKNFAIFATILAIVALCATAYLGLSIKLNGRTDGLAKAHFHAATTTLLISFLAHGLSLATIMKSKTPESVESAS